MKAWNRKHKPKHWSRPQWSTRIDEDYELGACSLVTRGLKYKYGIIGCFEQCLNNIPVHKVLTWSERRYK